MTPVSRETSAKLERYADLVRLENERQNLVARSTLDDFHTRHIGDAAPLVSHAKAGSHWCDIGSGAGLPGVVIAILTGDPVILIEPRRLRAEFLRTVVAELGLAGASVVEAKAEKVEGRFDVITARAVADTARLFAMTEHLAHAGTRWILPKGRSAKKELEAAQMSWQGEFRLVPSETSDEAHILVAERVRRKGRR